MIKDVELTEVQIVYKRVPLKEFIHDHADFTLFNPMPEQWAEMYDIPKGKRVIYITHEYYDTNGESNEHDMGFLILQLEECVDKSDLREFCLANLDRIIHANPDDR